MTRNLKALGLALIAAFALSAVAATAASAHTPATFTSGSDTTILTGELVADPNNHLLLETPGGLTITCTQMSLDSTHVGTDEETITAKPTFGGSCTASGFEATIDMNGCHYLLTASTQMHIVCPANTEIIFTAKILGAYRNCIEIPTQTPTVPTVHYNNGTYTPPGGGWKWDLEITSTLEGITYTKTGLCGSAEANDMHITGALTVKGEDAVGNPIDVTWDATVA